MDALKAEIASKRKALHDVPSRQNKYIRRGDLERLKEEQESKTCDETERLKVAKVEDRSATPQTEVCRCLSLALVTEDKNKLLIHHYWSSVYLTAVICLASPRHVA